MNGVEINTRAYVATRLLLRWDYLYAVTLKTKVFGDYNHARLEVSWITSTRGLLLRGYTGGDFMQTPRRRLWRPAAVHARSVFIGLRTRRSMLEGVKTTATFFQHVQFKSKIKVQNTSRIRRLNCKLIRRLLRLCGRNRFTTVTSLSLSLPLSWNPPVCGTCIPPHRHVAALAEAFAKQALGLHDVEDKACVNTSFCACALQVHLSMANRLEPLSLSVVQYYWRRPGTSYEDCLLFKKYEVDDILPDRTVAHLKRQVLSRQPKSDAVFMDMFVHRPRSATSANSPADSSSPSLACQDPESCSCRLLGPLDNHAELRQYRIVTGDVIQLWPQLHYRQRPWPFQ